MSIALQQMKDTVCLLSLIAEGYSNDKIELLHSKVHEAISNHEIYGYVRFVIMTIDLSIHNGTVGLNTIRFAEEINQFIPLDI